MAAVEGDREPSAHQATANPPPPPRGPFGHVSNVKAPGRTGPDLLAIITNALIDKYNREGVFDGQAAAALSNQIADVIKEVLPRMEAVLEYGAVQDMCKSLEAATVLSPTHAQEISDITLPLARAKATEAAHQAQLSHDTQAAQMAAAVAANEQAAAMREMAEATTKPHAAAHKASMRVLNEKTTDRDFEALRSQLARHVLDGTMTNPLLYRLFDFAFSEPGSLLANSKLMQFLIALVTGKYESDMRLCNTLSVVNENDQVVWYKMEQRGRHLYPLISSAERNLKVEELRAAVEPFIQADVGGATPELLSLSGAGTDKARPFGDVRLKSSLARLGDVSGGAVTQFGAKPEVDTVEYWVNLWSPNGEPVARADFHVLAQVLLEIKRQNGVVINGLRVMWDSINGKNKNRRGVRGGEADSLSADNQGVEQIFGVMRKDNEKARGEAERARTESVSLKNENANLKSEVERLRAEIAHLKTTNSRLIEKGKKLDPNF